MTKPRNVLAFSSHLPINMIFEDYCRGIKANSENYHYIDYIALYEKLGKSGFESHIERYIDEHAIDHIFFIWWSCDLTFDIAFIEKLSQRVTIVMNFFDTEYHFETVDRYYAQAADLVLLPDALSRYKYLHLDIPTHTTFSLFDSKHYAPRDHEKTMDVSFVGSVKLANRMANIQLIRDNGIAIEDFGAGTKNGFVDFTRMRDIFASSKINLNFTATSDASIYALNPPTVNQRIKQSKGRPIEASMCGGFMLSEYAAGIEEMFIIGEEIDVFRTGEELVEKIRYYLAHPQKREEMTKKAYDRAVQNYDTVAGMAKVFELLAIKTRKNSGKLYIDKSFIKNYTSFRFFYIAKFLARGDFPKLFEELKIVARNHRMGLRASWHFAVRAWLPMIQQHPKLAGMLKSFKDGIGLKVKY